MSNDITQDHIDVFLHRSLATLNQCTRDEIATAAVTILNSDAKQLRAYVPGKMAVLKLIKSLAILGYHYAIFRGRGDGDNIHLPTDRDSPVTEQDKSLVVDSGLVSSGKKIEFEYNLELFDDDSLKEKLKVMSKWDAMFDDSRNKQVPDNTDEQVDAFCQLGKKYNIKISLEEVES